MAKKKNPDQGKLRIGDQWNAIRIIALSQNNPLKALAEFVENSIDASASRVTIIRGKSHNEQYIKIIDDGHGIEDFTYVATHIADSIKRQLKERNTAGVQGEFGIGILSFWTVGEELSLTSMGSDGIVKRLHLTKDNPVFHIRKSRELFKTGGTAVHIQPLLPGVRMLNGEKIQAYLSAELRERISRSGVSIRIIDRTARKEWAVEPRRFHGHRIHDLPELRTPFGSVRAELYITSPSESAGIGLYREGTRVIANISRLDTFRHHPWTSGNIEGTLDASFLQLTPGTRDGVIFDAAFDALVHGLRTMEQALILRLEEERRAEEEEASRSMLRKITRAFREAFSMLPSEEYGWLTAKGKERRRGTAAGQDGGSQEELPGDAATDANPTADADRLDGIRFGADDDSSTEQRAFFEFPGPLYRLDIRPASALAAVRTERRLQAVARDKARRLVEGDVTIEWTILQGAGHLEPSRGEFVTYRAPAEPELAIIQAKAIQGDVNCEAESRLTVTAELIPSRTGENPISGSGLPGYTYRYAPGELWRSRYDVGPALITINSAHADFVFASRSSATKLRYVARLFAKEIVLANFPGAGTEELLERMVELNLYMETNLK